MRLNFVNRGEKRGMTGAGREGRTREPHVPTGGGGDFWFGSKKEKELPE